MVVAEWAPGGVKDSGLVAHSDDSGVSASDGDGDDDDGGSELSEAIPSSLDMIDALVRILVTGFNH